MSAITGSKDPSATIYSVSDDLFEMTFIGLLKGNPVTIPDFSESIKNVGRLALTNRTFYEKCESILDRLKDRLVILKEDQQCRDMGYHPELVEALRRRNISLLKLPVLDLGRRMGPTGYIDFVCEGEMSSPLMRFKDIIGRVGIAFHLRGNVDNVVRVINLDEDETAPGRVAISLREVRATVTIFQRSVEGESWAFGAREDQDKWGFQLSNIYEHIHEPDHLGLIGITCPTCPISTFQTLRWGCNIIDQRDQCWIIDGDIEQVKPEALPGQAPKPHQ